MNDEFLHALRRDPPPAFARDLKRRLDRRPARSSPSSIVRIMFGVFLIGGVAMAAALLLRDRDGPRREAARIMQSTAPSIPAPATQPARPPQPERQGTRGERPLSQTEEPEAKDIPVTIVTSRLARPLAQGFVERASKVGLAQPRVTTMEDNEAFRALCGNVDFVIASRRIADEELAQCVKWGIEIAEWKLGYQAVVLTAAPSTELPALTPRDVFLALARRIPDPAEPSRLIDNPNTTWHDVDARFDYRDIVVLMPPDATTRAAFQQLVMEPGCESFPQIARLKHLDWPRYDDICHELRSDGRLREVELGITLVTQRLWAQPNWLIVLGYPYFGMYRTQLMGTMLEGPVPTLASLSDGTYPAARPVYLYAQASQLNSNAAARSLAYELTGPYAYAVGAIGYLTRQGLVPLDDMPQQLRKENPR